ncbi:hypothetical protein MNBD_GAMMA26-1180 [hydrothermal vent metagenome]|uniref:Uncharacterized protein n=1 Tax=hydrothermal vent metagenome TaxID=652676 RepID=A0A3B1AUM5_9ZZZZ
MVKSLSGIIVFLTAFGVLALQIDDELNPAASQWVEKVNSAEESEAYLFLMGIFAKKSEDPIQVGRAIYQSIREGEERYLSKKSPFNYTDYPQEERINLPEGDLLCVVWEEGCLKTIFQDLQKIQTALKDHAMLLERYHEFIKKGEYRTLARPMITEPIPPFQYLLAGHRLNSMSAIINASNGNAEVAVKSLYSNITRLRGALVHQDTLLGKMFVLMMLSENLDVISILTERYKLDGLDEIRPISKEERDFELPMAREFSMSYNFLRDLDRNPELWEVGGEAPGWVVRVFFKPNMSINAVYPGYDNVAKASQLSQKEFAGYVENKSHLSVPKESLRNYIGSVINRTEGATMIKYVGYFYDINCKIALLNSLLATKNGKKGLFDAVNPYGTTDKPVVHENGDKLCFDGPLPDERNLRCLTIKI